MRSMYGMILFIESSRKQKMKQQTLKNKHTVVTADRVRKAVITGEAKVMISSNWW